MEHNENGGRVLSPVDHFGRIPAGLLLAAEMSDASKVAYAYLTTWDMGRGGKMFGGREAMASELGWSISKFDRALRELDDAGFIERKRRGLGLPNDIFLLAELAGDAESSVLTAGVVASDGSESAEATTSNTREKSRENQETREHLVLVEPETAREKTKPYEDEFAKVWKIYPRKKARAAALRAWQATRRRGVPAEVLSASTFAYAVARKGQDVEYTLHGSTFFGPDERWRDFDPAASIDEKLDRPDLDEMAKRAASGPQTGTKYEHVAPWESE